MFEGKTGAYLSEVPFKGRLLFLPENIRLLQKLDEKSFIKLALVESTFCHVSIRMVKLLLEMLPMGATTLIIMTLKTMTFSFMTLRIKL
jgi:hypothetical protein